MSKILQVKEMHVIGMTSIQNSILYETVTYVVYYVLGLKFPLACV